MKSGNNFANLMGGGGAVICIVVRRFEELLNNDKIPIQTSVDGYLS